MRWARRIRVAVGAFCTMATMALAVPITYTFSGTGTGTLGTTPFTGVAFTISGVGDTAGVSSSAGVFCNHLTSVTLTITGFATGSITDPLDIFDNTAFGGLGLQHGASCPGGLDWLDSPFLTAFNTYHLDTAIGPVALGSLNTDGSALSTSLGALSFSSTSASTFQAVLGGSASHVGAGELDPTFGTAGRAVLPADPAQNGYAYVNAIAVQPDAKIVMLGYGNADNGSLYRLTAYGALDASFGVGGKADARVPSPFGLALQPDGKLVVGGSAAAGFVLARVNADGTPDGSFGGGTGFASSLLGSLGGYTLKVLVQPDGKIIAIGTSNFASSATFNMIAVTRFLPDGSLDATFGGGGTQIHFIPGGATITPVDAVLQGDGKIVIVGYQFDTSYAPVLLRLTSAGQGDPGFATTAPGAMGFTLLYGVAVQADGKVVISGAGSANAMHARLNADGTPDGSYGTAGVAATPLSGFNGGAGMGMVLQPDGKVVSLWQDGGGSPLPRLVRLTTSGALDATFGSGGIAAVPMANTSYPRSLALQPDGKIVTGGEVRFGTGIGAGYVAHYGFWRYQGDQITGTIVEYFNTLLGHYFITASAAEQASIDAGGSGPGWTRTGYSFRSGGVSRACRFYGTPGVGPNSHFYTIDPAECAQVKMDPGWHFESYDFSATPAGPGNACDSGTTRVYRAYNHRFAQNDSNHRYTTDVSVYNAQVAAGWTGEGVVFCAPL